MPNGIVIISKADIATSLSHLLKHLFPNDSISHVKDASGLSSALYHVKTDLILIDWSFETINPSDVVQELRSRSSSQQCVVAAFCHSAAQIDVARTSGVDHAMSIGGVNDIESYLTQSFQLLHKLVESRTRSLALEGRVRKANENTKDVIDVLQRTIYARYPDSAHRADFIEKATAWIGAQFRNDDDVDLNLDQLRYASKLVYMGRINLPEAERNSPISQDGAATNVLTASVPLRANEIMADSIFLEETRSILRSLYENVDGTGFPDRIQHWQIPLGARILRVVVDLDEITHLSNCSYSAAMESINKLSRRVYDHRAVILLDEYVNVIAHPTKAKAGTTTVLLVDLREGMVLAADVVTNAGLKLMNSGTKLHQHLIDRMLSHNAMDPIIGNIYIVSGSSAA